MTATRFADARGLKAFAGSAPITRASGKKTVVLHRHIKNRRLAAVGPIWALAIAARLAGCPPPLRCPPRRRRLEPPSPTTPVQQIPRPTPPLPANRPALQRTPGVSTSSPTRGLTFNFVRCLSRDENFGKSGGGETNATPRVVSTRVGLYFGLIQLFFALTWVIYVIYLPRLAVQAGIDRGSVPWILVLDQVIFVVCDCAVGIAADRLAMVVGRLGKVVAGLTALSALAFLLIPLATRVSADYFSHSSSSGRSLPRRCVRRRSSCSAATHRPINNPGLGRCSSSARASRSPWRRFSPTGSPPTTRASCSPFRRFRSSW